MSPALAGGFFTTEPPGKPYFYGDFLFFTSGIASPPYHSLFRKHLSYSYQLVHPDEIHLLF